MPRKRCRSASTTAFLRLKVDEWARSGGNTSEVGELHVGGGEVSLEGTFKRDRAAQNLLNNDHHHV